MWDKVHNKLQLENNTVLACNFVGGYYVIVTQNNKEPLQHKIFVENIKQPIIINLEAEAKGDGYFIFKTNVLKQLPPKLLSKLLKQGLFMTDNKDRDISITTTSIHRLVCCIHHNCKGLEVHHINKDVGDNSFFNIVPVTSDINKQIECLYRHDKEQAINIGRELLNQLEENKQNKHKKKYLTNNDRLIKNIIEFGVGRTFKEMYKRFKKDIKTKQYLRDILSYFFYALEFIQWLIKYNGCRLYSKEHIHELLT